MTEAVTAHEITVRRVLDAPRDGVWNAWTQPAEIAAWWGPHGWSTPPDNVSIDLRTGGVMRITSVSDEDGAEMTTIGTFTDVVVQERLAFEESPEDAWHDGANSTVTFTDLGDGRTEMADHDTQVRDTTRVGGPAFKHAHVKDSDGNTWVLQELPS